MMLPQVLTTASLGIALEAVHRALRVIRFRDGADHMIAQLQRQKDDEATRIAMELLQQIERDAGRDISDLEESEAARHIEELSQFVQRRTRTEWEYDEASAASVLAELRSGSK